MNTFILYENHKVYIYIYFFFFFNHKVYIYITMKLFPLSRLEVMHRYFEPGFPKPTCMIIKKNKESKVGCLSGAF